MSGWELAGVLIVLLIAMLVFWILGPEDRDD